MGHRTTKIGGRFFPGDKAGLEAAVKAAFASAKGGVPEDAAQPIAVIAPHAGYAYCGPLTAMAWAQTRGTAPDRIAILSPSHHLEFDGIAVPSQHDAVALPSGRVRIDRRALQALIRSGKVHGRDAAFEAEHGIDTQLPFLRALHPQVPVVPVVIGSASAPAVAAMIDRLNKIKGKTLFVLSSDLSHFLAQDAAKRLDAETSVMIEAGQSAGLTGRHACGARALAGWLLSEPGRAARALRLGQGDASAQSGDASRVVGYGAWAFYAQEADIVPAAWRGMLLRTARLALQSRLLRGSGPVLDLAGFPDGLRTVMASFVTFEQAGRLRGCMGSVTARRPLVGDVAANAVLAGIGDRRFKPVTTADLPGLSLSVSVLTRPTALAVSDEAALHAALRPGETGLILRDGTKQALFLPSVWDKVQDAQGFVRALKQKAGLDPDHWSDSLQALSFRTESFVDEAQATASAA